MPTLPFLVFIDNILSRQPLLVLLYTPIIFAISNIVYSMAATSELDFILHFDLVSFLLAWNSRSKLHSAHASFVRSRHGRIEASFILLIWLTENVRWH